MTASLIGCWNADLFAACIILYVFAIDIDIKVSYYQTNKYFLNIF